MNEDNADNLRDKLAERRDDIIDYVEKNSPRPSVDRDVADRLLSDAPPAQAAEELDRMIEGFQSGAGAATGRRTEPAAGDPPTEEMAVDAPPERRPPGG